MVLAAVLIGAGSLWPAGGALAEAEAEGGALERLNAELERETLGGKALGVVLRMSRDRDAMLRANAIEAIQPMPDRAGPLVQRGLEDDRAVVRYAASVTAGMLELKSMREALRPLLRDASPSVRAASLYALHRLGAEVDITPLAGLLRSKDGRVRANVALLLGLIGEESAAPMLKAAAEAPLPKADAVDAAVVRCQIAEAIVRLGDDSELNTLRAGAYNTFGEVRVVSISAMGAVKDRRMIPALKQFLKDEPQKEPPEVKLAAAASLARMRDYAGRSTVLALSEHSDPRVRSQAAWAMGWFTGGRSEARLGALLEDETPTVRIAAASAVIRRSAAQGGGDAGGGERRGRPEGEGAGGPARPGGGGG